MKVSKKPNMYIIEVELPAQHHYYANSVPQESENESAKCDSV